MYGKGLIKGLGVTFKHFFQKEITMQYPEEMPKLQKRYRGCLQFEFEKCIVCGMCEKVCPNNVLHLDTIKPEGSKKKRLMRYTIDVQYCMFCNICVENCPGKCLSFNHNFELAQYRREDIKIVYDRPASLILKDKQEAEAAQAAAENAPVEDDKKQKKIAALLTALTKNPTKALSKLLEEEQAVVMSEIIAKDAKKAEKIAELMVEDMEKAKKIAVAFVNKELKDRQKAEQNREGGEEA
jgi:NADH-quinone oxidoreductase subunit I